MAPTDSIPEKTLPEHLGKRVAKGATYILVTRLILRSLGFINTIILARLLVPEDFGLVAIAASVMQLLQNVSDIGVSQTVIRFRHAGREQLDTLFTFSAIRGCLVMLLMLIISIFAGGFYDDPRIGAIFAALSVVPLLQSLINPKFYEFEREMDFSKDMWANSINKFCGVVVSITIAVVFKTYWAIVLGLATGVFVQLIISYVLKPHMPRLTLASFSELIQFTGWLTGVSFVVAFNNKLDPIILGRIIGIPATGTYHVADQVAGLPSAELATPIARAIYPGFSELQDDPKKLNETFLNGVEVLAAVALPAAIGCAFVAHDLVLILLGTKWELAGPIISILAPVIGLSSVFLSTHYYAIVHDKIRLLFYRELAFLIIRLPILIWASLKFGLMGAVIAVATTSLMHVVLNLIVYQSVSSRPFYEPLMRIRRSLLACLSIAIYFLVVRPVIPAIESAPLIIRLFLDTAAGGMAFVATHFTLWHLMRRPEGVETMIVDTINSFRLKNK